MPSWKKVVISGSDATLNSLTVSNGITGSLLGTSSYALTASFVDTVSTNAFVQGGNSFGTQALLGTNDNNNLAFETSGSVRMFISSSGNVGINTNNPQYTLHVSGSGNIFASNRVIAGGGVAADPSFATNSTIAGLFEPSYANLGFSSFGGEAGRIETSNRYWNIGMAGGTAKLNIRGIGATSSTTALRIENSNASASLVVLDDGSVGIGTASSVGRLFINSLPNAITGINNVRSFANTFFGGYGGTNFDYGLTVGMTAIAPIIQAVQLISSSADLSLQPYGGNVGIGVQSPVHRLQVDASGSANSDIPLALTSVDTNNNRVGILFGSSSLASGRQHKLFHRVNGSLVEWLIDTQADSLANWAFQPTDDSSYAVGIIAPFAIGSAARVYAGPRHSSLTLGAGGGNNHLTISSGSGFVGIGTTTPASQLDVQGNINIGVSGATTVSTYYNSTTRNQIIYTNNSSFEFIEGANERARIQSGNLLVGTTSNLARLQVRGSGATDSTTALRVENSNASASMVVLDNGNVGIGTTTPSASLQVAGDVRLASAADGSNALWIYRTSNNNWSLNSLNGVGEIWRVAGNSQTFYQVVTTSNGLNVTPGGNSTTSGLTITTGSYPAATLLRVGTSTLVVIGSNVGIGTTSPTTPLHVSASGNITLGRFETSGGTGRVQVLALYENVFRAGSDADNTDFWYDGGFATTYIDNNYPSTGGSFNQYGDIRFRRKLDGTNLSTVMTIRGNNGNVGIRTTTPNASLHVAGTTRLSGSFNTAASGSVLTVIGSGSAQPIFTVQGSQGELFSVTDSLSGSLFSVNDISGLPIMEVFSDNTILMGDYQAPTLYTTKKIASTTAGLNVIYSFPTSSYDGVFMDYTVKSGSNARAGNFASIWSDTAVNYMDNSTTDFGSTAGMVLSASISGSNIVIFASGSTAGWTFKGIIKSI